MSSLAGKGLAIFVFGVVFRFALHYTMGHIVISAGDAFSSLCPLPYKPSRLSKSGVYLDRISPAHLRYTGIPLIDRRFCLLNNFFIKSFEPSGYDVTLSIVFSSVSIISFPVLESVRNNRSILVAWPMILGLVYQNFAAGVVLPVYWALFILSGSTERRDQIERRQALAALLGIVIGYGLPSFAMFATREILPITMFQIFPLLVSVVQIITLIVLPKDEEFKSGHRIVQLTYCLGLISSAIPHLRLLSTGSEWKSTLYNLLVPEFQPLETKDQTLLAKHYLMWDGVFITLSGALFTLWFARNLKQLLLLILVHTLVTPVLGLNSAFALIMIWREVSYVHDHELDEDDGCDLHPVILGIYSNQHYSLKMFL